MFDVAAFDRLALAALAADQVVIAMVEGSVTATEVEQEQARQAARVARDAFNAFVGEQMTAAVDRAEGVNENSR